MARVLVVDDQYLIRASMRATLEQAGHQVEEAADGEVALSMLGRRLVDIVVTDIVMPNLDGFGLMTPNTVLAHAVLLSASDMDLIAAREAAVAHCPLSNVYFSNAVFPLRAALEKGLKVGLGTDIAGGPSASLYDTLRMTVTASRMLDEGVDPALPP